MQNSLRLCAMSPICENPINLWMVPYFQNARIADSRSAEMVRLSVNVNKVATLRNSRGGHAPSVLEAVRTCLAAGAPGITVHPRADRRHITPEDVREIAAELRSLRNRVE